MLVTLVSLSKSYNKFRRLFRPVSERAIEIENKKMLYDK